VYKEQAHQKAHSIKGLNLNAFETVPWQLDSSQQEDEVNFKRNKAPAEQGMNGQDFA
jgi:hypothetical protein